MDTILINAMISIAGAVALNTVESIFCFLRRKNKTGIITAVIKAAGLTHRGKALMISCVSSILKLLEIRPYEALRANRQIRAKRVRMEKSSAKILRIRALAKDQISKGTSIKKDIPWIKLRKINPQGWSKSETDPPIT
jgi:hypothetical protein